jgi:hypothetical protein
MHMSQCSSATATFKVCIPLLKYQLTRTDIFLTGAQVLVASLRDGGTTKKLAVIVPSDEAHQLLPETISQLEVPSFFSIY